MRTTRPVYLSVLAVGIAALLAISGSLKIIAAIRDLPVIVKILSHLGLPTRVGYGGCSNRRSSRLLPDAGAGWHGVPR